jgi:hypothetical protein
MEKLEFKGTQGEWSQSHRETETNGNYSTEVYCDRGATIATLSWYANTEVKGVISTYREANAKLIAAAPELLKALIKSVESMKLADEVEFRDEIKQAEQAINKALK